MNKRLKALRKALGLNQSEFAEKIGVAQNTVSQIENSSIGLNERNAKIICLTFDVNEHWLRTGEGEMFESHAFGVYSQEFSDNGGKMMMEEKEVNSEESGHGLDLIMECGDARPSNATAIRLLGEALEELEKKALCEMGGQIGGIREIAEIAIHTNASHVTGYIWLDFDADVLRKYLDKQRKGVI